MSKCLTVEPLNNGHGGDEHFVDFSEVVPLSEVEMYGQLMAGGKQFVHCREVVLLSEVLLYCQCRGGEGTEGGCLYTTKSRDAIGICLHISRFVCV